MNYKAGSQFKLIKDIKEDHRLYMFMNTTNKAARGWISLDKDTALKKMSKNNGMYEVIIYDKPRKVYFDCDFNGKDYIEEFKNLLLTLMPDAQLNISGSKQEFKNSYHIILDNYYFSDYEKQKCIKGFIENEKIDGKTLEKIGIDLVVYDKNRNFKCIGQSKTVTKDGKVTMSPYIQNYVSGSELNEKHLVCSFDYNNCKDAYEIFKYFHKEISMTVPLKRTPFNLTMITNPLINNLENTYFDLDKNDNVCNLFLNKDSIKYWDHQTSLNMCNYFIQMRKSFDEFWNFRKFKRDTKFDHDKWRRNWNYQKNKEIMSYERELELKRYIVLKLSSFYTNIGLVYYTRIYRDSLEVQSTKDIKRTELIKDDLISDKKVIILANQMGAGKTKTVLELSEDYETCCIITCRISLAKNIQSRTSSFVSYDDKKKLQLLSIPKCTQKNARENIILVNKLIITPNSIHYIKDKVYDLVVIDEIEVFLSSWSMTHNGESVMRGPNKNGSPQNMFIENYHQILRILKNAKKIIFMDALISYRSFRYLIRAKIIESEKEVEVITSSINRESTIVKHIFVEKESLESSEILSTKKALDMVCTHLSNKKRLYIFWPYIKPKPNANITRFTQKEVIGLIEDKVGRKMNYHLYNSENEKETLANVNFTWSECDFIMVNQSVTVGVSYDNLEQGKQFDHVFIFDASFVPIREFIQTSKRCRQLSDGGFIYYINMGGYSGGDFILSQLQKNDILIKNTVIDTHNENRAKKDFSNVYFTFLKAGMKFIGEKSDKVENFVIDTLKYADTNYLFENILVETEEIHIDEDEEQRQIYNLATKLCYLKKKFCRFFVGMDLEQALVNERVAHLWNRNKDLCFYLLETKEVKKLGTDSQSDKDIFKNLAMHLLNKVYNISYDNVDSDLSDIKLEPEIKKRLLNEINQCSLITNTYDIVLIQIYLNTLFRTNIISSLRQKGKNVKYIINEDNLDIIVDLIELLEEETLCMF